MAKLSSKLAVHFVFPPTMNESSYGSIFLLAFDVVSVVDFSHSQRYMLVPHYCFNLHFHNDT